MSGIYPALPKGTLANIIAQVVHFAVDDFGSDRTLPDERKVPEEVQWSIAYVVSCFLAQHTVEGSGGVDTECGTMMRPGDALPFEERVAMAQSLIDDMGGEVGTVNDPGQVVTDYLVSLTTNDRKALRSAVRGMVMQASADGTPLDEAEMAGVDKLLAKIAEVEEPAPAPEVTDEDVERWRGIEHTMRGSDYWYSEVNVFDFQREHLRRWLEGRK